MYTLNLKATSTASANGLDKNLATAVLMNSNEFVSGKEIEFHITTGSAVFPDDNQTISAITNSLGEASVGFTNTVEETVIVMAILSEDKTVYSTKTSIFSKSHPSTELKATRIYNDNNKEFSIGGPHYLFKGAAFYIELNESSSSTVWACDDDNVEVKNVNGMGHVTIKDTPASNVISITFSNSSGAGEYDVAFNIYINNIHADELSSASPTEEQYINIYKEWGDMSTFGWGRGGGTYYCYENNGQSLLCVDMSSGETTKCSNSPRSYATRNE